MWVFYCLLLQFFTSSYGRGIHLYISPSFSESMGKRLTEYPKATVRGPEETLKNDHGFGGIHPEPPIGAGVLGDVARPPTVGNGMCGPRNETVKN